MPEQLHKPIAILVLYQPKYRFRLKKYYLKSGKNYIGSHPRSQICLQDSGPTSAIITVTQDLVYIESCQKDSVYVPSNLIKKKNLMVQLQKNVKYVIQMQKDFMICRRKALMQILSLPELLLVKNVQNSTLFIKKIGILDNQNMSSQTEKLQQAQFQGTIPIQEGYNFEATIPIDNQQIQATIPIDQNVYGPTILLDGNMSYQPTLKLDEDNFDPTILFEDYQYEVEIDEQKKHKSRESMKNSSQIQNKIFLKSQSRRIINPSQFAHMNGSLPQQQFEKVQSVNKISQKRSSIKQPHKSEENVEEGDEFSMPETIREDEMMPQTIRQEMMPATIQQQKSSDKKKLQKKMTISVPLMRSKEADKFKKFNSYPVQPRQQEKPINDFEQLFGSMQDPPIQSSTTKKIEINQQSNKKVGQQPLVSNSSITQKIENSINNSEMQQSIQKNSKKSKLNNRKQNKNNNKLKKKLVPCGVVCCRRQQIKFKELQQKGYRVVDDPQDQFQILFVGNAGLKLSKRLMLSLIQGIPILNIATVTNPKAKITGKLQGFLWETIEKRKGKKGSIFNGKYYIQEELIQQYSDVMRAGGAELLNQLKKSDSRSKISLIIDQKTTQGKELYNQKKNYKNWKFYKKRMIIESILMGEEIKQKHQIQQYEIGS